MYKNQQRHTHPQIHNLKPNTSVQITTYEQNRPSHVSAAQYVETSLQNSERTNVYSPQKQNMTF